MNRAKGPVGLIRGGQTYIFWGCGKVRDLLKFSVIWGAG